MRKQKHWLLFGAVSILSLLAGTLAPALILPDNSRMLASSSPSPDLVVEVLNLSPDIPSTGDILTFNLSIRNQGNGHAGASQIDYYIDETYQTSALVNPMEPGVTVTKSFTWKTLPGPHTIRAIADAENDVDEIDETNNESIYAFSVLAPDLIIDAITWSPTDPSIGDKVTFTVTIKNQGNSQSRCSCADLQIDGHSRGYQDIPRIDASANVTTTFTWTAKEGAHEIKVMTDIFNKVIEQDETNNYKTVIYATAAPDLIVNSITWSPQNPLENNEIIFTVTVKNQGTGKAEYSHLAFYINDNHQTSYYVDQLNPGTTATKTFTWSMPANSLDFKAIVDASDRIDESDETNNEKTVAPSTPAPDLIIASITFSPRSPLIAHKTSIIVTLKNQGSMSAPRSVVYLFIDGSYQWKQVIGGLEASATASMTFPWVSQRDSIFVKAVADGDNTINESNESNNTKTTTITFSKASPSADLVVQDITWSPSSPVIGNTITLTANIKNQGTVQATPSYVDYYIDDVHQTSSYVNQVDAGGTITSTFTWKAQAGSHTVRAVIDSYNSVAEKDENNNETMAVLAILAPDLVIQDITWSPKRPSTGDTITLTVTINNQGNYNAGYSYVSYYIDGNHRGHHDVKEIDAEATTTTSFAWTTQPGLHTIRAFVDMEGLVAESNEANNENVVIFPSPDLVIDEITWSPTNPAEGSVVTFTAGIKNLGNDIADYSSSSFYIDDVYQNSAAVNQIEPNAVFTNTFTWIAETGNHTMKIIANSADSIIENYKANNEKMATFSVTQSSSPELQSELDSNRTPATSPQQMESGEAPDCQNGGVSSVQDAESEPPPKTPTASSIWWQKAMRNIGFFAGVTIVVAVGIIVLLRLRRRT